MCCDNDKSAENLKATEKHSAAGFALYDKHHYGALEGAIYGFLQRCTVNPGCVVLCRYKS